MDSFYNYTPEERKNDNHADESESRQSLSAVIRRAARRIPRPLPTALVMLQAAGVNIDGEA